MDERERPTDAEFTVINGPSAPPSIVTDQPTRVPWWRRLTFAKPEALLTVLFFVGAASLGRCAMQQRVNAPSADSAGTVAAEQPLPRSAHP